MRHWEQRIPVSLVVERGWAEFVQAFIACIARMQALILL